jgi:hypothetical protein
MPLETYKEVGPVTASLFSSRVGLEKSGPDFLPRGAPLYQISHLHLQNSWRYGGRYVHFAFARFTKSSPAQRVSHEPWCNRARYRQTEVTFDKETPHGESEKIGLIDVT